MRRVKLPTKAEKLAGGGSPTDGGSAPATNENEVVGGSSGTPQPV